jgi:hypothetical protein
MTAQDLWITSDTDAPEQPGYCAPTVKASGDCRSRMTSPREYSLWSLTAHLGAGAELMWDENHGDEAVYVQSGSLTYDGRVCPADGALILESGVPAVVRVNEPTTVIHFGPWDPAPPASGAYGAPASEGHCVHVVGPGGTFAKIEPGRASKFYADSTWPTSRITLLYTSRSEPYVSNPHSHSEDEIIHLLSGEIQVGQTVLSKGYTLGIAGDRRYRFKSGDKGFGFLNYRRDASYMTIEKDSEPFLEGGALHHFDKVMDLR